MSKEKGILVIDLILIPDYMDIEDWMNILNKHKMVFYDSTLAPEAKPPYVLDGEIDKIMVDISTKEGKEKLKKLRENE